MSTEQLNADILINDPPMILGATENVIPDPAVPAGEPVVGVPLSLFRTVFNPQLGVLANAVTALVDPPPREGTGADPISIALWLNGLLLEERQIQDADRDKRTSFNLFESSLLDGRNNRLEYKVTRPSGNVGDSTPLWVLYREQLPGGNNVPGDDEHPYLDIRLPAELGDPALIGKDEMDAGVPMTVFYPFMYDYDVIHFELRRERFTYKVQPGQAGHPVGVTLTREMFELAGNSADFAMSYTVISQLNNATDKRRWSKTLKAEVDKDLNVLTQPILREVRSESGDDPSIIDREKLEGRPLLAVVVPSAPKFEVGDSVQGRYTATPSGADQPFTGIIEDDGFGRFELCIMDIPNDKVVVNDHVVATYSLLRSGTVVGKSRKATARVIGEDAITLNPPTLMPPATSPINVLEYDAGVTVRVTFAGNPGDQAQLKELNPAPGATPFPAQEFNAGQADFTLGPVFLAARQGKSVELSWVLIRAGVELAESSPLRLSLLPIANEDARLPEPLIVESNGKDVLELDSFAGNATVKIKPWTPWMAVGQKVSLRCVGTQENGSPLVISLLDNKSVSAAEVTNGLSAVLARSELEKLKEGSQLVTELTVAFNGGSDAQDLIDFPENKVRIVIAPFVASENFDSVPDHVIGTDSRVETPSMFISRDPESDMLANTWISISGVRFPGKIEGQALSIGSTDLGKAGVFLELKSKCSSVSFWQMGSYSSHQAKYFDENNKLLGQKTLTISPTTPAQVTFSASEIKVIKIFAWDIIIDNFTFQK